MSASNAGRVSAADLGKVAVLMGGHSAEREVSLMSGTGVLHALRSQGVDAHAFDPAAKALSTLKDEGFQRAFVCLHGRMGEDGCLQGALEWLRLPYTGSGVAASALAMDKVMTKRLWLSHGLSTPQFEELHRDQVNLQAVRGIPDRLGLPLIMKPPHEGSSLGVHKVKGYSEALSAAEDAARYDSVVLCEQFIDGDEVTCPVLGQGADAVALPVVRIVAPDGDYNYQNKYHTDTTHYHCPSGYSDVQNEAIQALVVNAYQVLGCRGWGRADLMIRKSDLQPFLLEMNTSPGMTSHSLVPKSAAAAGIDYASLCMRILAMATLDHAQTPNSGGTQ